MNVLIGILAIVLSLFAFLLITGLVRIYKHAEGTLRVAIASGGSSTEDETVFHFASKMAASHDFLKRRFGDRAKESFVALTSGEREVKRFTIPASA
jgi:hypothetical protein